MSAQVTNSFQNTVHTYMLTYSDWCRGWKCTENTDWIGLSSVLRPRQHSISYMGDGFYRSKDPTNCIKVLKEQIVHRQ